MLKITIINWVKTQLKVKHTVGLLILQRLSFSHLHHCLIMFSYALENGIQILTGNLQLTTYMAVAIAILTQAGN